MEPDDDKKKKLNEDLVVFLRKRSETEAPRYTARLKTYVDFQQKRRRAAAARRHSEHGHEKKSNSATRKKTEVEQKEKTGDNQFEPTYRDNNGDDDRHSKREGFLRKRSTERPVTTGVDKTRSRSFSRSHSEEPSDACCRRKRCPKRKRRRSCCPRRRRRSSCRRKRRRSCRRRKKPCCPRRRRRRC